jgi:hypothetical protein
MDVAISRLSNTSAVAARPMIDVTTSPASPPRGRRLDSEIAAREQEGQQRPQAGTQRGQTENKLARAEAGYSRSLQPVNRDGLVVT